MTTEEAKFAVSDLVLDVSTSVDPAVFDVDAYEGFFEVLCGPREFQAEALRSSLRFLAGGKYANTAELASENFEKNPNLANRYGSLDTMIQELPFPEKLACAIDLATGTGKSFVMYGVARVLLNERLVDRVLVLCPSLTIESGLLEKFLSLSASKELCDALPKRSGIRNPDIIQATGTLEAGTICVENIHATYTGTKSAIGESLRGKGHHTLVLNDEAHHIYSPGDAALKKWMKFLTNEDYGFGRIVGFSGTCYKGNDYFSDVVHRYSLSQAIEDATVKKVFYVDEDTSSTTDEAFQKILDNHETNRKRYAPLKPLTILVTKDIKAAKVLHDELINFLKGKKKNKTNPDASVLIVTSDPAHKSNVTALLHVDESPNPVEWIVSVSMLTEGWDVKNVFQIVPHEQRAFNSKLLIAQVLGRGLRIPESYVGQPEVRIFNHQKWAPAIRHLVHEVMELDVRVSSYPVDERSKQHFEIDQIIYKAKEGVEKVSPAKGETSIPSSIDLSPQAVVVKRHVKYKEVLGSGEQEQSVDIEYPMKPVSEVASRVVKMLRSIDLETGSTYAKKASQKDIERTIRDSLKAAKYAGDEVTEENEQKILAAFGPLARRKSKQRPRITVEIEALAIVSTESIPERSISVGALRKDAGLVYDDVSLASGREEDRKLLQEIDDGHPYGGAVTKVMNSYNFKTPTNVGLVSHRPERLFVKQLVRAENAKCLHGWIKSPDSHFYGIEFTYRKGDHQKQSSFNPDFFLMVDGGKDVLVVETKMDGDDTPENKGKLKYADQHFGLLNEKQNMRRYLFYFLSPKDYDKFFQALRDGSYPGFQSELHTTLKKNSNSVAPASTASPGPKKKAAAAKT